MMDKSIRFMKAALARAAFCALLCLPLRAPFAEEAAAKKAQINVQSVEVLVDNVPEDGISEQISGMAKSALAGSKIFEKAAKARDGKRYAIKINVRERSFYKSVDNFHSLYARYQLFSEDGSCLFENVFCSESKRSILSAVVQRRQVEKIARDLKKYFESGTEGDA